MDALAACLELQPSAVELMDHLLLELTAGNLALRDTMKAIQRPAASGVHGRVQRRRRRRGGRPRRAACVAGLAGVAGLTAAVPALDPAVRDPLWDLRKAGDAAAVRHARRPQAGHVRRGHGRRAGAAAGVRRRASATCCTVTAPTAPSTATPASAACTSGRCLNLKDPGDVARMRRITEDVTDLVLEYGGSLSGEHGDGLARSEWNEKMFGPAVYQAFCRSQGRRSTPSSLLNPGKIVDAPPMTENLRYGPGYRAGRAADGLRLRQAGGLRPLRRDVQRQRRLPQDAGRDDVPVVPRHARREGQHARPGQRPAPGAVRASSRCAN